MPPKRFLFLTVLLSIHLCLSLIISGPCFGQGWRFKKAQGTLKIADFISPQISIAVNCVEGLVSVDSNNQWAPCLAEDWRWIDNRTIEFKLRRGVIFHNGEQFDAYTVGTNWKRYCEMKRPRPHRFLIPSNETEFKIIDDYTVKFRFPKPDGLALVKFRWFFQIAPSFFKRHTFVEGNWGYFSEPGPWGTGPFELVEGNVRFHGASRRVVLHAFPDYWDRHYPKVEKIIFDNNLSGDRDEAVKVCSEQEEGLDVVSFIRPLDTLKVAESRFAKVVKSKDVTTFGCWFNERKKGSKWKDVRLRKALNHAINRDEIWKYGAKGNAFNLGGFIPPGAYGYNPELRLYEYDTAKAKSLLTEAGYADGFAVRIIAYEAWKPEAQIIARMLERIGLTVDLEITGMPAWFKKVYIPILDEPPEESHWDIAVGYLQDWHAHVGASFFNLWWLDTGDWRWIEYDPLFEEMWQTMAGTLESRKQEEVVRRMAKYVYDNAYMIFIYSPTVLYATNREVNFVPQKSGWLLLKETSVTDRDWSLRGKNN